MGQAPGLAEVELAIRSFRGQRVLLAPDLARLYQVTPSALMQAVKRNSERFPADFMFQLDANEWQDLKSQSVISSWGGARLAPYAFTPNPERRPIGFTADLEGKNNQ